jgi:hypothetical protein
VPIVKSEAIAGGRKFFVWACVCDQCARVYPHADTDPLSAGYEARDDGWIVGISLAHFAPERVPCVCPRCQREK